MVASRSKIDEGGNVPAAAADPDRAARWAAWQAENAEAIESFNRWYAENGHPLAAYIAP